MNIIYISVGGIFLLVFFLFAIRRKDTDPKTIKSKIKGAPINNSGFKAHELNAAKTNNEVSIERDKKMNCRQRQGKSN